MSFIKMDIFTGTQFQCNGGTDKLSYYASFNYLDQGGLMRLGEESYKRYNATAKINAQPTKWMKMNYSIRFHVRITHVLPI